MFRTRRPRSSSVRGCPAPGCAVAYEDCYQHRADEVVLAYALAHGQAVRDREELTCEDCRLSYTVWYADDDLWNAVMRPADYTSEPFLCARCFLVRAEPLTGSARVTWPETPSRHDRELCPRCTSDTCPGRDDLLDCTLEVEGRGNGRMEARALLRASQTSTGADRP